MLKSLSLRGCLAAPLPYLLSSTRSLAQRPAVNTSQLVEGRRTGALAMKVGMLAIFDKWGKRHAVTALQLDHCQVTQVKTEETNGYVALQLGVGEAKPNRVKISKKGHFEANNLETINRKLMEFRVTDDCILPVGTKISAMHFVPGQLVDVCGTSRGKGFAGVMKRHNFSGGRATHGNSLSHRVPGSTGQSQDPGRTFKGKKMPGRMGGKRATAQNLKIMKIDPQRDVIYIKGACPGPNGSFVRIVDAVMGPFYPEEPPMPTFIGDLPVEHLFAPAPEKDSSDYAVPADAY
jgi:large subunit ribosomal protein L3